MFQICQYFIKKADILLENLKLFLAWIDNQLFIRIIWTVAFWNLQKQKRLF